MACWVNALDAGTALCVFAFLAILTGGAPDAGGILGGSATAPGSDDRMLLLACLACVPVLVRAAS